MWILWKSLSCSQFLVVSHCPNTANVDFMEISIMFPISCGFSLPKYGKCGFYRNLYHVPNFLWFLVAKYGKCGLYEISIMFPISCDFSLPKYGKFGLYGHLYHVLNFLWFLIAQIRQIMSVAVTINVRIASSLNIKILRNESSFSISSLKWKQITDFFRQHFAHLTHVTSLVQLHSQRVS